jgi:TonB family protein
VQSVIAAFLLAVITSTAAPPGCPLGPIGLVGCCREAPRLLTRVDAPYREVARRRHLHGIVIIELIIEPNGNVCAARVLLGLDAEFDRAAIASVKRWKFRPAIGNSGKAVTVAFNVTVKTDGPATLPS